MAKKTNKYKLSQEQMQGLLATIYQELKVVFSEMESSTLKKNKKAINAGKDTLDNLETVLKAAFGHIPSETDAPIYTIFENSN